MKKLLFLIFFLFLGAGCGAGQFTVQPLDTRFSTNKDLTYVSENNRISTKSIAGGIHIDEKGVYVNPFVARDARTGRINLLGFSVLNKTDHGTTRGGPNQLGIIQEVAFRLADGNLLVLKAGDQETRSSDRITFNTVTQTAGNSVFEYGAVLISKRDFERLAFTPQLSAKITGTRRSVVYETRDISPEFQANLRTFYENYIAE